MANARVSILLDAKDRASREIRQADGALGKLRATGRAAAIAMTALAAAVGASAVAFDRLAKRGGEVLNLQRAFGKFFPQTTQALGEMREATRGLVSDFDLMQQANQAMVLGAVDTSAAFADLAEKALILGRAQGKDALTSLSSLTLGIARQSRMLLDNLGITVSVEEANRKYAEANNLAADSLTAEQRQQAFLNETLVQADAALERVGETTLNNADNIQRMKIEWGNAKDAAAAFVAESDDIAAGIGKIETAVDGLVESVEGMDPDGFWSRFRAIVEGHPTLGPLSRLFSDDGGGAGGRIGPVRRIEGRPAPPTFDPNGAPIPGAPNIVLPPIPGVTMPGFGPFGITAPGAVEGAVRGRRAHGLTAPTPEPPGDTARDIADAPDIPGLNEVEEEAESADLALHGLGAAVHGLSRAAADGTLGLDDFAASIGNAVASAVGGIEGQLIGAGVDILSTALSTLGERDQMGPLITQNPGRFDYGASPVQVAVAEYGPRAERTMRDINQDVVRDVFINGQMATDEQVRQLGYRQGRIARLRGESPTGV